MEGDNQIAEQRDERITKVRELYEMIKPRKLQKDKIRENLIKAMKETEKEFNYFISRPDGSRFLQILFIRSNSTVFDAEDKEDVRTTMLNLLIPVLLTACQTRYQYRVVLTVIKHGSKAQIMQIYNALFGEFGGLIRHKIGCSILDSLYQKVPAEYKNKMLFDIFWDNKKGKEKLTEEMVAEFDFKDTTKYNTKIDMFEEYSKILAEKRNKGKSHKSEIYLLDIKKHFEYIIEFVAGKGLMKYYIVQEIVNESAKREPSILAGLIVHILEMAGSPTGCVVALRSVQASSASDLFGTLSVIIPNDKKVEPKQKQIPGIGLSKSDDESEEENEEQEEQKDEEKMDEEEEINEEGEEVSAEEEDGETLNDLCKLATNENAWRALSAVISYIHTKKDAALLNTAFNALKDTQKNKVITEAIKDLNDEQKAKVLAAANSIVKANPNTANKDESTDIMKAVAMIDTNEKTGVLSAAYQLLSNERKEAISNKVFSFDQKTTDAATAESATKVTSAYMTIVANLFQYWEQIKGSEYAQKVIYRMLTVTPSVYEGIPFQPDEINEELAKMVTERLVELIPESVSDLAKYPQGSGIIIEVLRRTEETEDFDKIFNAVFTLDMVKDRIGNKLIKSAIQKLGSRCQETVKEFVKDDKELLEVLHTPGSYVIAELCLNDKNLLKRATNLIKKNKLEEKGGIQAILSPKSVDEKMKMHSERRHMNANRRKRGAGQ